MELKREGGVGEEGRRRRRREMEVKRERGGGEEGRRWK